MQLRERVAAYAATHPGVTPRELATALRVSRSTAWRALHTLDAARERVRARQRVLSARDQRIVDRARQDPSVTTEALAAELHCSRDIVQRVRKAHGCSWTLVTEAVRAAVIARKRATPDVTASVLAAEHDLSCAAVYKILRAMHLSGPSRPCGSIRDIERLVASIGSLPR